MENRNKKESEERNMKLKRAVVVLMAVGLCMLTGETINLMLASGQQLSFREWKGGKRFQKKMVIK